MLVDLWLNEEKTTCLGGDFLALSTQEFIRVYAQTTALCTGGVGALFPKSSNPKIATGDGIAIARKNGVLTELLSYVQFHPTVYSAPDLPPLLDFRSPQGTRSFAPRHQRTQIYARNRRPRRIGA